MIRDDQRAHLKALMDWHVQERALIGYIQQRPEAPVGYFESQLDSYFRHKIKQEWDCSTEVMILCHLAGLRDPSGNGYNGFGNSAEFYDHLAHYENPLDTMTGSIVVFGPNGASHAAMVYEGGIEDPMLCSHGTPAGPGFVSLSAFATEYPEHTFCSIGNL